MKEKKLDTKFVLFEPFAHRWAVRIDNDQLHNVLNRFIEREYRGGKYNLLQLTSRIDKAILPEVKLLDMKTEPRQKGSPYFSSELVESLRVRLLKKRTKHFIFKSPRFCTVNTLP